MGKYEELIFINPFIELSFHFSITSVTTYNKNRLLLLLLLFVEVFVVVVFVV